MDTSAFLPDNETSKRDFLTKLLRLGISVSVTSVSVHDFFIQLPSLLHCLFFLRPLQYNENRAKGELCHPDGRLKHLKQGQKIRVFDFGHVYYGTVRDLIVDSNCQFWIRGSYAKDTDPRVTAVHSLHLLLLCGKFIDWTWNSSVFSLLPHLP